MSKRNATRRKQKARDTRAEERALIEAGLADEELALRRLGRALIPLDEKKNLITKEELAFIVKRYGAENTVACTKFAEQVCSIRWAAKQAGKTEMPPIYLPIVDAKDIDPRTCVIGIREMPFKRPELLPIPGHKLREELMRQNQFFEAVLLSLPILPLPVFTPKLILLCTGLSWTVTSNSFDLFRYYMAVAHLLSGTGDVVSKQASKAAEDELRANQRAVYEELCARFDSELKALLSGGEASAESLRALELWSFDFTQNYLVCYERYILQFLSRENQTPISKRAVDSIDDLISVKEDSHADRKRKIVADGIPPEYAGEFYSKGAHPVVELHCSDSMMDDVRKTARMVSSAREKVSGYPHLRLEEGATLQARYLPLDLLLRLAAFVRNDESVHDDLLRFAREHERKRGALLEAAGIPAHPPPLEPAPSAEAAADELTEKFKALAASETPEAVARATAASMNVQPASPAARSFEDVLYSK